MYSKANSKAIWQLKASFNGDEFRKNDAMMSS